MVCNAPAPITILSGGATNMYGTYFDITFACNGNSSITATLKINPASQIHGGGLNSNYYPLSLNFISGVSSGPTVGFMAVAYDGVSWSYYGIAYDGPSNKLRLSSPTMWGNGASYGSTFNSQLSVCPYPMLIGAGGLFGMGGAVCTYPAPTYTFQAGLGFGLSCPAGLTVGPQITDVNGNLVDSCTALPVGTTCPYGTLYTPPVAGPFSWNPAWGGTPASCADAQPATPYTEAAFSGGIQMQTVLNPTWTNGCTSFEARL